MSANPAANFATALIERHRFEEAFVFWHARHADDAPGALAALAALARQATRERQHQLAASYHAMYTALRRGSRWYPGMLADRLLPLYDVAVSSHRLRHDAEQLAYLHQLGVLGDAFPPIIARYRRLAARLESRQDQRVGQSMGLRVEPRLGLSMEPHIGQSTGHCVAQRLGLSTDQRLGQRTGQRVHQHPEQRLGQSIGLRGDHHGDSIARHDGQAGVGRPDHRALLSTDEQDTIDEAYDRIIHLRPTPCVAQPFSSDALAAARRPQPAHGIAVIDDFLAPDALDELWRFCVQSTIWFGEQGHGRLGATFDHGFNCPLLVQVAQGVFGDSRQLLGLRAGKHPPRLPGESLHGEVQGLKVQLWLTPDTANLDPAGGGMVIRDHDGRTRHIRYRQNRAVLFNARLAHGAASCHFRDDHASARIEVAMLYAAP